MHWIGRWVGPSQSGCCGEEIAYWASNPSLPTHSLDIIHTHTHTYFPWILKFVMATMGSGVSHNDTKHTDKCSNYKTKTTQKQNDKITDKYFFKIL